MGNKRNIEDYIGQEFGRLTVLGEGEPKLQSNGYYRRTVRCQCNCENHTICDIYVSDLFRREDGKRKPTRSCGCLWWEALQELPQLFKTKPNKWSNKLTDEYGDYYIGWTNNTNKEFYIDTNDYDIVKQYCWYEHVDQTGYHSLQTTVNEKTLKMTRLLNVVNWDHADRNPLNNRRYNLREATGSQQMVNRNKRKDNKSGIIGVRYVDNQHRVRCWYAELKVNKVKVLSEFYLTKDEAIRARLRAEADFVGEFAPQKHLFEEYGIITS